MLVAERMTEDFYLYFSESITKIDFSYISSFSELNRLTVSVISIT